MHAGRFKGLPRLIFKLRNTIRVPKVYVGMDNSQLRKLIYKEGGCGTGPEMAGR
jgi:hypothetical protein